MFTNDEIYDCAKYLGIDFSKFSFEELVTGVTVLKMLILVLYIQKKLIGIYLI